MASGKLPRPNVKAAAQKGKTTSTKQTTSKPTIAKASGRK